jgi:MFS transporter, OFA family, oxalate/formate antiporter
MSILVTVLVLMAFQFTTTMTMSFILSVSPALADYFNISIALVPYLNIGFIASGILVPLFGYFADKKGLKNMLVLGTIIFSIGTLLTSFATTSAVYFVTRMIIGIGHNVFFALVAVYYARLVDPKILVKVSGYFKLAFASGIFAAPIVGALTVRYFNFQIFYLFSFALSFILSLLILRIPVIENSHTSPITLNDFKSLLKIRFVKWLLIATFFLAIAPNTIFSFLSIYLNSIGETQESISFIYTIIGVGTIGSGFVIIFLGHKYKFKDLLKYGIIGIILSLPLIFTLNAWVILPASFAFALSFDLVLGVLFPVASSMPVKNSASLTAMLSLTMSATSLLTSFINPILYQLSGFRILLFIVFVASILSYFSIRKSFKLVDELKLSVNQN